MRDIDQHICQLLYDHDCVIVPELGGFLASYKSAAIHPVHQTISPPARKVAFNVFLKQNDGLLANRLSGVEHVTYTEALNKIEAYAAVCRNALNEGKKVLVSGVGLLYNDAEKNLQFEPLASSNFLRDSFGFAPIQHLPVAREDQKQKAEKQLKEFVTIRPSVKKDQKPVVARSSKKILSRVIVASAVLWLGVNTFLVLKNNKDVIAFLHPSGQKTEKGAPLQPASQQPSSAQASVQPPVNTESTAAIISIPETIVMEKKDDAVHSAGEPVAVNEQKNFSEKEILSPSQPVREEKIIPESKTNAGENKYFIIAGAFGIPSNATSLVEQLQKEGFSNAHIVSSSHKLTLVCYDAYATRHEANQILDTIRNNKRDGWVFAN